MRRCRSLTASVITGALVLVTTPAAAQHARLEEAWAVCDKVSSRYGMHTALNAEAPAAGFPKQREGIYAVRDSNRQVLVLSYEVVDDGDADQCVVLSNGGEKSQMVERAARFWTSRGYRTVENSMADYAALPRDDHSLGVFLRRNSDGFWRMEVSGRQ